MARRGRSSCSPRRISPLVVPSRPTRTRGRPRTCPRPREPGFRTPKRTTSWLARRACPATWWRLASTSSRRSSASSARGRRSGARSCGRRSRPSYPGGVRGSCRRPDGAPSDPSGRGPGSGRARSERAVAGAKPARRARGGGGGHSRPGRWRTARSGARCQAAAERQGRAGARRPRRRAHVRRVAARSRSRCAGRRTAGHRERHRGEEPRLLRAHPSAGVVRRSHPARRPRRRTRCCSSTPSERNGPGSGA